MSVVTYTYNAQQQRTGMTDQNGTVHAYDYDKLGRQTADRVTTAGTGVNTDVLRIEQTYDVRGLLEHVTSYSAASGGSVVNDVLRTYNDFGREKGTSLIVDVRRVPTHRHVRIDCQTEIASCLRLVGGTDREK